MLHERPDFPDLLTTIGEATGAGAAIVEKDYWVTEALRVIARDFSEGAVFKGGTSLSKAWNLIQRFSEDIDLLIRTEGEGLDGRSQRDRYMKEIEKAVAGIEGLKDLPDDTHARSERGISRTCVYAYQSKAATHGFESTIIFEIGIRGGPHPTAAREIRSMLSAALAETDLDDPTLTPFTIECLEPSRTLVEKLFAIHSACELWTEGRTNALQRQGRHYNDIYSLLGDPVVAEFVGTDAYHTLIPEIDAIGREYFKRDHRSPPEMRFSDSRALSPDGELAAAIEADFVRSELLFYGERPDTSAIYARIAEHRSRL